MPWKRNNKHIGWKRRNRTVLFEGDMIFTSKNQGMHLNLLELISDSSRVVGYKINIHIQKIVIYNFIYQLNSGNQNQTLQYYLQLPQR